MMDEDLITSLADEEELEAEGASFDLEGDDEFPSDDGDLSEDGDSSDIDTEEEA